MYKLNAKTVFITGASSGIGQACAEQFAAAGARLILTARRIDRITALAETLQKEHGINALPIQLDVRNSAMVKDVITQLPDAWKNIDILLNNAGLSLRSDNIQDSDTHNWDTMIDTNIKGLLYVTRAILPGMIERDAGHIINLGSVAGHEYYGGGGVYCATKHAVKAISKTLRIDLLGMPIRVSSIDPGMVKTEFSEVRWNDKERGDRFYASARPLFADDIADAVLYCATRKPHINVSEMIIYPTDQASTNHLYRPDGKGGDLFDE